MYEFVAPVLAEEQAEKKNLRRSANFCGFLILAMLAAQTLISGVLIAAGQFGALDLAADDYGLGNTGYLLLNMLLYLLFLPVPAIAVALISRSRIQPFPARKVRSGLLLCLFFAGMGMAILSNLLSNYLLNILVNLGVPYPHFPSTMELTGTSLILNIISTAVFPALLEEMVFRGYIQTALRPYGEGLAVVMSALIFGLFHGNILQVPFAFLMGLVFGWVMVQTGSIWPCVLLHFGNNLMSTLLEYFSLASPDTEQALIMITFTVVSAVGMIALVALLVRDRGGSAPTEVLRPLYNGVSPLSVPRRFFGILLAPAMLVSMILLLFELAASMVAQ